MRIFETGIALLDELYLERFLDACNQALACKVKIEILLQALVSGRRRGADPAAGVSLVTGSR